MLKELLLNIFNMLSSLNNAGGAAFPNLKGKVLPYIKLKSAFLVLSSVLWSYKLNGFHNVTALL